MQKDIYKKLTEKYIGAFNRKALSEIMSMFCEGGILEDPVVRHIEGKDEIYKAISQIFGDYSHLEFRARNIYRDGTVTLIEFDLRLDDMMLQGVDVIEWDDHRIKSLRAYINTPH